MKGIFLSIVFFLFDVLLTVWMLRRYRGKKYLRVFLLAFAITVTVYSAAYALLPEDIGFLPSQWLEWNTAVDFWNGILLLALLFHCFADVAYTTVLTGFSTNLLVHVAKRGPLTARDIEEIYGVTGGRDPVTDWRMEHLVQGKYVLADKDGYRMLPKGGAVASLARFLQKLFNVGEGG